MSIVDNIKKLADNEGITITALEAAIGASKGVLSRALTKNTDIQSKWLLGVVENYPHYNSEWLITGEGEMLKNAKTKNSNTVRDFSLKTDTRQHIQQIPLYNLEASAGLVHLFSQRQHVEDYISIPNLPKCDGAIYVVGDSMYPLLKSGDIVMYKQVQDIINGIFWGEMYLLSFEIAGDTYTMIKWLQRSELGPEYIKLVSENQHHQPKDILLSSIKAMAYIKASIRINSMT